MVRLVRTIRFCVGGATALPAEPPRNGFAGSPRMDGFGAFYELDVACEGEPDAVTGYLINIKDIDRAVRASAIETLSKLAASNTAVGDGEVMQRLAGGLAGSLEGLYRSVRWHRTPTLSLEHHMSAPDAVVLRQRFDFAAAHRLHAPELSAEENERIFGKCNNPSGHGHNYVVEPAVSVGISDGATGFGLRDLEELCINLVIDRFDHTHLNIDTEEFGPDGVMPSVENIARVIHRLLDTPIADRGARLDAVTVWETDRTCCTYPAGSPG